MIVGTAGHIDHGKTALVRALTGVDTDRLPEEKKRGISIQLGYAFLDLPDGDDRIGFIDVPGHERLVHTMLAGATGIDFALLLVAADDGVMPQTREHLAVLSLLGVARGAVVVTKIDRVDTARVHLVCAEAAALLGGTSLDRAPVLAVSALRGDGLTELQALLFEAARSQVRSGSDGTAFRLAIDRSFTLDGVGTVVTGTVHGGSASVGDELVLVPAMTRVRVRSLHAQNQPVARAHAGQRCAMAVVGATRAGIERGQWLVAPQAALATDRFDVALTLWHAETSALRSGTRVHVHLGATAVAGSLALLDREALAPAETAQVQLVLRTAVGAWHGDRVVLRDASATRTIAGGVVLDPFGPVRYRRTRQRLAELAAQSLPDAPARLTALLGIARHGVNLRNFVIAGAGPMLPAMPFALRHSGPQSEWALGEEQTACARANVRAVLAQYHDKHPDELGPEVTRLHRLAEPRLPAPLWRALVAALQREGVVAVRGAFVHLPEHGVALSATEQRIACKVIPRVAMAGFDGAWARDLARDAGEPEPLTRATLARLAQRGELHQVVKHLFYAPEAMGRLAAIVRATAAGNGGEVAAALFRDGTQLGRKRAVQILEYFDRVGLLRRLGEVHKLRVDSTLFADPP